MERSPTGKTITGFTKRSPTPREATPQLQPEGAADAEGAAEDYGISLPLDSGELPIPVIRRAAVLPPQLDRKKSRLALMPLTVLLPELGEAGRLHAYRQHVMKRLQELGAHDGGEDRRREHSAEEAMLNQVTKWLSLGVRE